MKIARFAVHRPVFVTMVTLMVALLGAISLSRLPVDLLPDISFPTLSIRTTYQNASPEEIEELITRPVEQALSAVPGVIEVGSDSSEGSSDVTVTFSWGTDLDTAANDVRDRLDRIISVLPEDAERPILRKFDPANFPILILGASSNLDPIQMRRIIEDEVGYRIERVPGVAAMDIRGGLAREIHVDLKPDSLKALGIPLNSVISKIKTANITLPAGIVESGNYEITLRTPGEYTSLDQLNLTTIAVRNGVTILLNDVADVSDSWEKERRLVRVNGQPGLRVTVNKQSGTNTVDVAQRVLEEIEAINNDIPQLHLVPIIDTSEYIERSITNAGTSAVFGGIFAVIVLMIFLRSIRSTAIIAVAIPISIIATFTMMYFSGFTLNLMTLGGLALGVGMLVDSAIVVLENIFRIRESDYDAMGAAILGSEEVTSAIIASNLTTIVIFLPMIFVRGMAGIMFRQLAYVVSFALLCSLTVALTLIPMLASRFLRVNVKLSGSHRRSDLSVLHTSLESAYKKLLDKALHHRVTVAIAVVAILLGSLLLIPLIGTELMPQSDEGEVRVSVEMEVGTRLALVDDAMRAIEKIVVQEVPEIKNFVTTVGGGMGGYSGSVNEGEIRVALVSQAERTRSSEDVASVLRRKLSAIPGATIRIRAGQGLFLLRRMAGNTERVEVEIRGYDIDTSHVLSEKVMQLVSGIRGVTDARISRATGAQERIVTVDRAKAEAMKVSVQDIAELLQTVMSGTRAGYYRENGDEFSIRVKLKDAEQQTLNEILDLTLVNGDGRPVVLRNFISLRSKMGMIDIERKNQERIVSVQANIAQRDLGSIQDEIREKLRLMPVPRGFSISLGGDFDEQQKTFRELGFGLVLSLLLVYMVMACLYESFRDPFIVMFSVPFAIIGVILILLITGTTFNMQSFIGCIMLGGIVVNNAILLVDYTNLLRRQYGLPLEEAIKEAGRRRLRPIMMTTMTTISGLIPLALGLGEGGETQAPLAITVIGGLLSAGLITLVFIPIVYSLFERNGRSGKITSDISATNGAKPGMEETK
ncbi:efflux RND transporter permease subunit [bacterium]|nr:efflux RND transporter permease subunit [candidate division CSSED10-310 bacterium]